MATAALAAALVYRPGDRSLAVDVYFLVLGALALLAVLRSTVARLPPEPSSPLDHGAGPSPSRRPPDLAELEAVVELAAESEFDLYFRLRPTLRRIAAGTLRRHGIDLDAQDGRAAAALGPAAWEIVRLDGQRPDDQRSRRRAIGAIESTVEALERL